MGTPKATGKANALHEAKVAIASDMYALKHEMENIYKCIGQLFEEVNYLLEQIKLNKTDILNSEKKICDTFKNPYGDRLSKNEERKAYSAIAKARSKRSLPNGTNSPRD